MTLSIAVAGKGGSGKTSIASLAVRYLVKQGMGPILAVDADPNANFGDSLGLEVTQTVGSMLGQFQKEKIDIPSGMTKEVYLEYRLNEVMAEGKDVDLVTMGRGEGPDCYCYPNSILKKFIETLMDNYACMVMDNEAGMEHLSRRTTQNVDELLIVSGYSVKGVRAAARIVELVAELNLDVKRQTFILNAAPPEMDPVITEEMSRLGLEPAAIVPQDEAILKYDLAVKPLLDLPDDSPAVVAVNALFNNLLKKS